MRNDNNYWCMLSFHHIKKLLLGDKKIHQEKEEYQSILIRRFHKLKSVWNNDNHHDIGIEKVVRLTLAILQFFLLGTYIKQIFGGRGRAVRDFAIDIYVLLKTFFPLFVLMYGWSGNMFVLVVVMYMVTETLIYAPAHIFAPDLFSKPRSYRRSLLLLFFNYLEIIFSFAVMYTYGDFFNQPMINWYDPLYFSFITSTTIGYGDFYPVTMIGKMLVSTQSLIYLVFVVLFITFYSNRVEKHGYFAEE